jgi:hypothetical protein
MDFRARVIVALVGSGAIMATASGQVGYSIQSNGDDHLYEIDLVTGLATDQGLINFGDSEGMTFGPGGFLYGIGGSIDEFWNVTTNTLIGPTGTRTGSDAGLDWDGSTMYNLNGSSGGSGLYTIDTTSGMATQIGSSTIFADNLAIHPAGRAFAIDGVFTDSLYAVDLSTGELVLVGSLGVGNISVQFGSAFVIDRLYALASDGGIYTVDTLTGAMTLNTMVKDASGNTMTGWEGLAVRPIPGPSGMLLVILGLCTTGRHRTRRP